MVTENVGGQYMPMLVKVSFILLSFMSTRIVNRACQSFLARHSIPEHGYLIKALPINRLTPSSVLFSYSSCGV